VSNVSADRRLLLGTVGWERPDWATGYYPPDLPDDWRLAYYANDCSCVLLPAAVWCAAARDELDLLLDETPPHLCFFLEAPGSGQLGDCAALELFAARRALLLTAASGTASGPLACWAAQGADVWADSDSGARLVRWSIERFDLRELRARAQRLDARAAALVLDGPGASPGRVPELRRLLELLGRA
jgi:hypothetical protein